MIICPGVMTMPRTSRAVSRSGFYHIVARGIGRQIIFEDEKDDLYFLGLLKRYQNEEKFDVIAYCLMENHFHLLLKTDSAPGRVMKKLATAYAFYFNSKYERTGHLFQDRFKSQPVENDAYLLSAVRYIHNNPAKAGICPADRYPWSSWNAYAGSDSLVRTDLVLGLAGGKEGFLDFSGREDDTVEISHLEVTGNNRLSDQKAKKIIKEKLRISSGTGLQRLDRVSRDSALRVLKEAGLSVRQIERLTGINRGVVLKA